MTDPIRYSRDDPEGTESGAPRSGIPQTTPPKPEGRVDAIDYSAPDPTATAVEESRTGYVVAMDGTRIPVKNDALRYRDAKTDEERLAIVAENEAFADSVTPAPSPVFLRIASAFGEIDRWEKRTEFVNGLEITILRLVMANGDSVSARGANLADAQSAIEAKAPKYRALPSRI